MSYTYQSFGTLLPKSYEPQLPIPGKKLQIVQGECGAFYSETTIDLSDIRRLKPRFFNFRDCNFRGDWTDLDLSGCEIIVQSSEKAIQFERCNLKGTRLVVPNTYTPGSGYTFNLPLTNCAFDRYTDIHTLDGSLIQARPNGLILEAYNSVIPKDRSNLGYWSWASLCQFGTYRGWIAHHGGESKINQPAPLMEELVAHLLYRKESGFNYESNNWAQTTLSYALSQASNAANDYGLSQYDKAFPIPDWSH